MRFTVSSTALSSKLNALSRVINSKNSLPILADFVFDINNGMLQLTASDSENVMTTQLELTDVDGYGRFAVGNHDLLEAVKGFSEQPLTFDIDQQANIAKISYQNGLFSLPVESADEFPMAQKVSESAIEIVIPNSLLAENINRTLFATAQDELRPVMNGIYFDLTPDHLAVVASDGHKLVRNKVFTIKSDQPAAFILPKKPANLLKNLLGKDGGDVTIRFDERNAEINYGDGTLQCRLIEGRYPNYNAVIPVNNPYIATVDRVALASALKRVSVFCNQSSGLVKVELNNNNLKLTGQDNEYATSAEEYLICDYSNNPISIGFSCQFLLEIANILEDDNLTIELADPSRPGVLRPANDDPQDEILMLLMPMRVED